jgi:prephenate dehydratase
MQLIINTMQITKPIGYWGGEYTFTHQATKKRFPKSDLISYPTHKDLYRSLESDIISHAVLPIHNSTAGTVPETLNTITEIGEESDVEIIDEIFLPINHCIYSKKQLNINEIERYYTIQIAKNQCSNWISSRLGDRAIYQAVPHNINAAEEILKSRIDEKVAAIGPVELAEHHNFYIIENKIQDHIHNTTRFIVLSKENSLSAHDFPGFYCKATIAIILNDRRGALADVVDAISKRNFDIVHLKMTPIVGKGNDNWKDWFIFDLLLDKNNKISIESLRSYLRNDSDKVRYATLLGLYPDRQHDSTGKAKKFVKSNNEEQKRGKEEFVGGAAFSLEDINTIRESEFVEFKSSFRWDYNNNAVNNELDKPVIKSIAAFLNSKGGNLIIGVNDNGDVLGIEKDIETVKGKNMDGFERALTDRITTKIGAEIADFVEIKFIQINEHTICQVRVSTSPSPVYVDNSDYYVRFGSTTRSLSPKETAEHIKNRNKL